MLYRFALDERVEHLTHARIFGKFVFASFEAALPLHIYEVDDAGHEDAPVGDHAIAFERLGDAVRSFATRDCDHRRGGKRARFVELHLDPIEHADDKTGQDEEEGEEALEHPAERMLVRVRLVWNGGGA